MQVKFIFIYKEEKSVKILFLSSIYNFKTFSI